jgi:peptidoglycan/xylan/chitin deacetylase (PgdA/CDA1 family)
MLHKFVRFTRNSLCFTLSLLPTLLSRNENIILTYHSIGLDDVFDTVEPKNFIRQLKYLKKKYKIVSLATIIEFINTGKRTTKRMVSITFDDGFLDFYLNVFPLLRKDNLPATLFVATDYIGKDWPFTKSHPKMLNWEQIDELSKNNIEIGAHTVTHPHLQKKKIEEAEQEIKKSKEEIEKHIGRSVNFFSYPFGSYKPEIVDIVKSAGFKGGVGGKGTIQKHAQIFVLNRIQVDSSISFIFFKSRLTKAVDFVTLIEEPTKKLEKYFKALISYFN